MVSSVTGAVVVVAVGVLAVLFAGVVVLLAYSFVEHRRKTANFSVNGKRVPHTPWSPPLNDLAAQLKDIVAYTKWLEEHYLRGGGAATATSNGGDGTSEKDEEQREEEGEGLEALAMTNGPVSHLALFSERLIKLCYSADQLKFGRDFSSFGLSARLLSESILAASGPRWRMQHRAFSELFTPAAIKEYRHIYCSHTRNLMAKIEQAMDDKTGSATVDVCSLLKDLTNQVVCDAIFGEDVPIDRRASLLRGIVDLLGMCEHPLAHLHPIFYKIFWFLPFVRRQHEIFAQLDDDVDALIACRVKALESEGYKPNCLIDHILRHNEEVVNEDEKFSPAEIRGNVRTIFSAGTDTTACSMSWTLYHLSRNPDEYKKVVDEVRSVSLESDMEDYPVLFRESHLFAAINESLRVSPPAVATVQRDVPEARTLSKGDVKVSFPAKTTFSVHIYVYHHLKHLWKDPFKFKPSRMLGRFISPAAAMHDFKFIPFGAGPRMCIGKHLAYDEMVSVLSRLLQRYDIVHDDTVVEPAVMWPIVNPAGNCMRLTFKRRQER